MNDCDHADSAHRSMTQGVLIPFVAIKHVLASASLHHVRDVISADLRSKDRIHTLIEPG
jgi:hypothetical protein